MPATDSATRYVDALSETYDVLLDAARAAGEARQRIAQRLFDEAEKAQQRTIALVRRVAENPVDFAGNGTALIEAAADAQAQALGLTRAWLEATPETGEQARTRLERFTRANQELVRAAVAASRDLYTLNPWLQAFRAFAGAAEPEAAQPADGKAAR